MIFPNLKLYIKYTPIHNNNAHWQIGITILGYLRNVTPHLYRDERKLMSKQEIDLSKITNVKNKSI